MYPLFHKLQLFFAVLSNHCSNSAISSLGITITMPLCMLISSQYKSPDILVLSKSKTFFLLLCWILQYFRIWDQRYEEWDFSIWQAYSPIYFLHYFQTPLSILSLAFTSLLLCNYFISCLFLHFSTATID